MKVIETKIPGVLIVETDVFGDHRGYFTETYSKPKYEKLGITVDFVQDNMSFSAQKGTLRGLHWQNPPYAQSKLVSCTKGKVIDVAEVTKLASLPSKETLYSMLASALLGNIRNLAVVLDQAREKQAENA